jgi:hypothetical protein
MYHTPLTWYEQKNLGYRAHFEARTPEHCGFASLLVRSNTKALRVGPTDHYTRYETNNSALFEFT